MKVTIHDDACQVQADIVDSQEAIEELLDCLPEGWHSSEECT